MLPYVFIWRYCEILRRYPITSLLAAYLSVYRSMEQVQV